MELINPFVISNDVFWMITAGLISIAVSVVIFEVGRLFKLVAAVRDIKDEMADIRRQLETIKDKLS